VTVRVGGVNYTAGTTITLEEAQTIRISATHSSGISEVTYTAGNGSTERFPGDSTELSFTGTGRVDLSVTATAINGTASAVTIHTLNITPKPTQPPTTQPPPPPTQAQNISAGQPLDLSAYLDSRGVPVKPPEGWDPTGRTNPHGLSPSFLDDLIRHGIPLGPGTEAGYVEGVRWPSWSNQFWQPGDPVGWTRYIEMSALYDTEGYCMRGFDRNGFDREGRHYNNPHYDSTLTPEEAQNLLDAPPIWD
jgi:hypothetical protein